MSKNDDCWDQLLEVRSQIDAAIREYLFTGCVPDDICQQFREEALALLADWDMAGENTARYLEEERP